MNVPPFRSSGAKASDPLYWATITPPLTALFRRGRLFTKPRGGERWVPGTNINFHLDSAIEPYGHILGGLTVPRAIGAFSYIHSACDEHVSIGRYCSIAGGVAWMGDAHPTRWATMSPFTHCPQPLPGFAAYLQDLEATIDLFDFDQGSREIMIGHDVWIGQNVVIKRGIRIGTGAVIGAGSIVTRDVPPYAIVAGNPARMIRTRFSEDIGMRLLASEWWRHGPDVLQPLDARDPERFLDLLEAIEATPLVFKPITGKDILAAARQTAEEDR